MRTNTIRYGLLILALSFLTACNSSGGSSGNTSGGSSGNTIGGNITGLTGTGLVLRNNAGDDLVVAAGSSRFTFAKSIASGGSYAVTVLSQPQSQTCSVVNGSGTVANNNISSVSINCVADSQHFIYVLNDNQDINSISAYSINESTGVLSAVPSSPFPVGSNAGKTGNNLIVDPTGRFIYMIRYQAGFFGTSVQRPVNILAYSINQETGVLTKVPGSPFATGISPSAITIDPTGKFAYIDGSRGLRDYKFVYAINNTGALTEVPGAAMTGVNGSPSFDSSGKFAFVGCNAYTVDTNTGAFTTVPGNPLVPSPQSCSFYLFGQFVYVFSSTTPSPDISASVSWSLYSFRIDTNAGTLTAVSGSPFSLGQHSTSHGYGYNSLLVAPSGKFAYAFKADPNPGPSCLTTGTYPINDSTGVWGAAVSGDPFSGSGNFCGANIDFDSTGKFFYTFNISSGLYDGYAVNDSTGALTPIPGSPFSIGGGLTFDPSGKLAYRLTTDGMASGTISAYTVDATTGVLAPVVGGQALPTGGGARVSVQ